MNTTFTFTLSVEVEGRKFARSFIIDPGDDDATRKRRFDQAAVQALSFLKTYVSREQRIAELELELITAKAMHNHCSRHHAAPGEPCSPEIGACDHRLSGRVPR